MRTVMATMIYHIHAQLPRILLLLIMIIIIIMITIIMMMIIIIMKGCEVATHILCQCI